MNDLKQIRIAVGIVIFGLVISGVTAFPLLHELNLLAFLLVGEGHYQPELHTGLVHWILTVREGLESSRSTPGFAAAQAAHAATYTWERAAAAYLDVYDEILKRKVA